jgi:hypothetical protein
LTLGSLLTLILGGWVAADAGEARTLLVIPPRHTVVQLAFGVARLRPVYLVAYDTRVPGSGLVLHFWDTRRNDWVRTTTDGFRAGALFDELPGRIVLVGTDKDVPAEVASAAAGLGKVQRVSSLLVKDMINSLDEGMKFTAGEWKWLAKTYGLQIVDLNEERRMYGRYGPPGSRPPAPPSAEPSAVPVAREPADGEGPINPGAPAPAPVEPLPQDK